MVAPWPQDDPALIDEAAESEMGRLMEIVRAIRNIRAEVGVAPGKKISAVIQAEPGQAKGLEATRGYLTTLAGLGQVRITEDQAEKPPKAMTAVAGGTQIFLPLADLVDLDKERARLQKELANAAAEAARLTGQTGQRGLPGQGAGGRGGEGTRETGRGGGSPGEAGGQAGGAMMAQWQVLSRPFATKARSKAGSVIEVCTMLSEAVSTHPRSSTTPTLPLRLSSGRGLIFFAMCITAKGAACCAPT